MKRAISIALFFIPFLAKAQIEPAAKQIALGNSAYAKANDVFALFVNPAGLSQFNWTETGAYYSPAPFGLKELSNGSFAAKFNLWNFSFAAGASFYGFELYKENSVSLAISKRLFEKFFLGATAVYHNLSIEKYGAASAVSFNFGLLYYLTKSLRLAFVANNPFRASYSGEENEIPTEMKIAASYSPLTNLDFNIALAEDFRFPLEVRCGVEYGIVKYVDLRAGFESGANSYAFGIGVKYSLFEIDYAALVHRSLPLTHQLNIIFAFENIENRCEKISKFLFGK